MKIQALLLLLFIFTRVALAEDLHDHNHENHDKSSPALHLNKGKKWPTDLTLRTNMAAIHNHVKKNMGKINSKSMTPQEYKKLGKAIKVNINTIFKSCKLSAEADAQLHIIMAGLLGANKTLTDESDKHEKRKAIDLTLSHYRNYMKYFDTGKK